MKSLSNSHIQQREQARCFKALKDMSRHKCNPPKDLLVNDKVDINFLSSLEDEMVPVIISHNDEMKSKLLGLSTGDSSFQLPRNVKCVEELEGGDYIAQVPKSAIDKLKKDGYNVVSNDVQFALPMFSEDMDYMECDPFSSEMNETNKAREVNMYATTRIDELPTKGKGITVALIDTGVAPNKDLEGKIVLSVDLVNGKETLYDDNGHASNIGTEIAGTGILSDGKYKGTAPEAALASFKALNSRGGTRISDIVRSIDMAIQNRDQYNIRVINLSLGIPSAGYKNDPIHKAIERANKAGIVVVAAAGNEGPKTGSVSGSPGNSPLAITVGSVDDKKTVDKSDDTIPNFSSRGPTMDGLSKPDILAPGVDIIGANVKGSYLDRTARAIEHIKNIPDEQLKDLPSALLESFGLNAKMIEGKSPSELRGFLDKRLEKLDIVDENYLSMEGTSMSAGLVSGIVADMLEANPNLSPAQVKDILMKTADSIGQAKTAQGAGVIDASEAIEVAMNTKGELPDTFKQLAENFKSKYSDPGYLIATEQKPSTAIA